MPLFLPSDTVPSASSDDQRRKQQQQNLPIHDAVLTALSTPRGSNKRQRGKEYWEQELQTGNHDDDHTRRRKKSRITQRGIVVGINDKVKFGPNHNNEYVDIRIERETGQVSKSCERKFCIILQRVVCLGQPVMYKNRFLSLADNNSYGQRKIASYVFGAMRNTESVRFLQRDDESNKWIETERQNCIQLIVSALREQLTEQNIRPMTNKHMNDKDDDNGNNYRNRHRSKTIGGRKNNNNDDDDYDYVDIRIEGSGQIVKSNQESFRNIFLRAISRGKPVPYKELYRSAKDNYHQFQVGGYVLGAMRNVEFVRFLCRDDNSNRWVEAGRQQLEKVIRLIVTALSAELLSNEQTIIQPTENDVLMTNLDRSEERDKIRQAVGFVLQLGRPTTYSQKYRCCGTSKQKQLQVTESMLDDIRNYTHPPIRFLCHSRKISGWREENKLKVVNTLNNCIRLILHETRPRENDVLEFGIFGENGSKFDHHEGNKKLRKILLAEDYSNKYRNACLIKNSPADRIDQILDVHKQALKRTQSINPPMRFLFQVPGYDSYMESTDRRRMLSINRFLWNLNNNVQPGDDDARLGNRKFVSTTTNDFLIAGCGSQPFNAKDTEQFLGLAYSTGKLDDCIRQFRLATTRDRKQYVVNELLFIIQILNPRLRFIRRRNNNDSKLYRMKELIIVPHLYNILTNSSTRANNRFGSNQKKALESGKGCPQHENTTPQNESTSLIVQNNLLPSNKKSIESGEDNDNDNGNDDDDDDEYFIFDDTIFIDVKPQETVPEQQRGLIVRMASTNDVFATTTVVKQEQEEEGEENRSTSSLGKQPSNFSTGKITESANHQNKCNIYYNTKIKQAKKEEPTKDQIKVKEAEECGNNRPDHGANKNEGKRDGHNIENSNIKQEDENIDDENPEIIEIDPSDDGSNLESNAKYLPHNDRPPVIKSVDVNMSDVSLAGDFESSISKTEASITTGRTATAIRIVRIVCGRSLEVTLPSSTILQCLDGNDLLRSAANQAVLDRVPLFIFGDDIKKTIYNETKVVRYEFRGQNPTSAQFKLLPIDDILRGDTLTVQITMSIHDVERKGDVTIEESLF